MSDLDKIVLHQAMIMSGLAILLVPGAETSHADLRIKAANQLNETASEIWKAFLHQ